MYGKQTDRKDLKLLCVYYFLLRKGVNSIANFC